MKIIDIKGGLGNQLFQYAYGRNLELSGKKIIFNTSFFNGDKAKIDTARNFKLNNFNIKTKAQFLDKKRTISKIIKKILGKIGVKQEEYFQSEKYFINIAEVIRQEFTLANEATDASKDIISSIKNTEIPVSVHVRRGDYVKDAKTNQYHGSCPPDYYEKALARIAQELGTDESKKIKLFIFSDDIEWVEQNLSFPFETNFVSNPLIPDYEELVIMSNCAHNIIANSSFSWWAAWLNNNPKKIVIAPEKWLNTKPKMYKDIVPKTWIKI